MYAALDDLRIFFDIEGPLLRSGEIGYVEAPILLCLHGGPGVDHTTLRPFLSPLAESMQLVYLDHRGNGRSDHGETDDWNLAKWGDDIRRFCSATGVERPIVFGHSFGAAVALSYATRHPDHPVGLVLSGYSGRMDPGVLARAFDELGGPEAADAAWNHFCDPSSAKAEKRFDEICIPLYIRSGDTPALDAAIKNEAVRRHYTEHEAFNVDFSDSFELIRCPTLFVVGSDDPFCSSEALASLGQRFPAAEVVVVDNAGHAPYRDKPAEFNQLVHEFVAALGQQSSDPR